MGSLITAAVLIYYETLCRLSTLMPRKASRHRYHILVGALGALCAHIIEIWLFAFGYYFMVNSGKVGTLRGNFDNILLDYGYFSFTAYSTLGLGDIEPVGNIRFLVGLESLTGLVLITWTASFMFVEMQNSGITIDRRYLTKTRVALLRSRIHAKQARDEVRLGLYVAADPTRPGIGFSETWHLR